MRIPKPWRVPYNKATSLQFVNIGLLGWWTIMLVVHHDAYQRSSVYEAFSLMPDVYSWAVGIGLLAIGNVLPMLRWWRRNVNHSYLTKTVGMILSAGWWAFLAMIFLMGGGPSLGFGVHFAIAIGCIYESVQISNVRES